MEILVIFICVVASFYCIVLTGMVGRKNLGAKVQIYDSLTASADKILLKKEIYALKAYKPAAGYLESTVGDVRYESS